MAAFTLLSVTAVTSVTAGFKLVSRQMKPKVVIVSSLCHPCEHFRQNYDRVQAMIARIGCMDELISGTMHVCSSSSQASSPSSF